MAGEIHERDICGGDVRSKVSCRGYMALAVKVFAKLSAMVVGIAARGALLPQGYFLPWGQVSLAVGARAD